LKSKIPLEKVLPKYTFRKGIAKIYLLGKGIAKIREYEGKSLNCKSIICLINYNFYIKCII